MLVSLKIAAGAFIRAGQAGKGLDVSQKTLNPFQTCLTSHTHPQIRDLAEPKLNVIKYPDKDEESLI